jgi:uncharacterized Zn finger protein
MKGPPCKACGVPGRPNHTRQRVIIRKGKRVQVCEKCGKVLFRLGKPKRDEMDALLVRRAS